MSSPVMLRGAEWTVAGEVAPEAPSGRVGAVCATCRDASPWENDPKLVGMWTLEHLHRNSAVHTLFLVTTQRHWRAYPTPRSGGPPAPRTPRSHARRRARRLRRVGAFAGHAVPALSALSALSALCLPGMSAHVRMGVDGDGEVGRG